jgi:DNA-directed RNA polymerase specialized sigma24 family protein
VVALRYLEDLSEQETAAVLGIATGTVKSQAARGLARLRLSLPVDVDEDVDADVDEGAEP